MLIVDDEPTVRFGLRAYFDWSSYSIEVVGEASDGEAALEEAIRTKPDLVFTDVRMPKMNGIRLAGKLRELYPHIKIIFVSGHDDADYLKSALQVSAVDYIFKPVSLEELRTVVVRVVNELQAEETERRLSNDMQVKLRESMPLLREKFLLSLLGNDVSQMDRLKERLDFFELNLPVDAAYMVLVISVDNLAAVFKARKERDRQLLSYSILNICQELFDLHMGGYGFETRSGEFVGIMRCREDEEHEERLLSLATDIRENLERWLKISVTIGVGDRVSGLAEVHGAYNGAREAAGRKWYLGKNRIITMDSMEISEEQVLRFDYASIERLASQIKAGEYELLAATLDAMFGRLSSNRQDGFLYGQNIALQITLLSGQLLLELGISSPEFVAKEKELWQQFLAKETLVELLSLLEEYLKEVCTLIREKRNGKSRDLVERVQAIVEQCYAENLTVVDIGRKVYLTPTYVSLLYKQETGKTITDYLTHVRMEKAKEMLRDPRTKFYDVCTSVGYADPSYFTKLFKKVVGMTPSTYREQLGKGG